MPAGLNFPGLKSGQSKQGMLDIDIKPLPMILVGQFEALAVSVRTFRKPLEESVRRVIIPSIQENFNVAGRPPWEPLSAYTEDIRRRKGYGTGRGAEILVRTGKGRRSAVAFARWTFTKESATMGGSFPSSARYMPIHQIASVETVIGGNGAELPGRPFALIQDQDIPKIEAIFALFLQAKVKEHGFK